MRYYYYRFDHYDLIAFPILYSTEVGEESDTVDVLRISPEDATSLLDERAAGFHKVAGNELGHFGAFLERAWREDDILWGRLDGAERLIASELMSRARTCHAKALASDAKTSGKVVIVIRLAPSGEVESATAVENKDLPAALAACVASAARRLQFESSAHGATLRVPLTFAPRQ